MIPGIYNDVNRIFHFKENDLSVVFNLKKNY